MGEAEGEDVRLQNNLEEKCNQSSLPHGSPTRKPQEFVQKKEYLGSMRNTVISAFPISEPNQPTPSQRHGMEMLCWGYCSQVPTN